MRIVYTKLSLEIIQIVENDNSITALSPNAGAIQGDAETIRTTGISLGLDSSIDEWSTLTQELIDSFDEYLGII
jgi:hypothetical protein